MPERASAPESRWLSVKRYLMSLVVVADLTTSRQRWSSVGMRCVIGRAQGSGMGCDSKAQATVLP